MQKTFRLVIDFYVKKIVFEEITKREQKGTSLRSNTVTLKIELWKLYTVKYRINFEFLTFDSVLAWSFCLRPFILVGCQETEKIQSAF